MRHVLGVKMSAVFVFAVHDLQSFGLDNVSGSTVFLLTA